MATDLRRFRFERMALRRFFSQNVKLVRTAMKAEPVDFCKVNVEYHKLADKAERLFLLDSKIREALLNDDTLVEEDSDPINSPSRLFKEFEEVEAYREAWCSIISQRQDLLEKHDMLDMVKVEPPDVEREDIEGYTFTFGQAVTPDEAAKPKRKRSSPAAGLASGVLCAICSGDHANEYCLKLRKMDPGSRIKALKDKNLCLKCLQKFHDGRRCRTTPCCVFCSKSHATAMCSDPLEDSDYSDASGGEAAEIVGESLNNATQDQVQSSDVDWEAIVGNTFAQPGTPDDETPKPKRKLSSSTAAELVSPESGGLCAFCSGDHPNEYCLTLRKMDPGSRIKAVKDRNLCVRCLQKCHAGQCNTTPCCFFCSKSHATAMCSDPLADSDYSDASGGEAAEIVGESLNNATQNQVQSSDVDWEAIVGNTFAQPGTPDDETPKPKRKFSSSTAAELVSPESGDCAFCSGDHPNEYCLTLRKMDPGSRIKAVKDRNLCVRCLRKFHAGQCNTTPCCFFCSKTHATSMCPYPSRTDSDSETSFDEATEDDEGENMSNTTQGRVRSSLKNHKQYKCSLCHYKAACQSFLDRHILTHTGEKPFACRKCDYRANRKHLLERHMMSHTKKKPYKCKICDYGAIQKIQLTQHMMSHKGKKPFACDECDYAAVRKANLEQHKKTHSDERPYACEDCDYRAKLKWHLRQHVTSHFRT